MRGRETVERHHLTRRGNTWFVQLDVPAALREKLGRRLSATTQTADILIARERREPILARFRAQVARAHAEAQTPGLASFLWLEKAAADAELKAVRLVQQAAQERDAAKWALDQLARLDPSRTPVTAHQEPATGPSFRMAAEACVAGKKAGWKSDRWTPILDRYAFPMLGDVPVADITSEHLLRILEPMWRTIPDAGGRLRRIVESVLDYARTRGWRNGADNPAKWQGNLEHTLPPIGRVKPAGRHAALDWREVPALVSRLRSLDTNAAKALTFSILTAGRKSEALGAKWSEFNLEAKLWTIPASRMKSGREHRVPLSDAALDILTEMQTRRLPRHRDIVFPGRLGQMSSATYHRLLVETLGLNVTGHGFRSSFRDWCADNGHPADIAEMSLAHVVGSKVERAYARSDLLDRRRPLMDQWAEFCGGCSIGST
jgi:integrase